MPIKQQKNSPPAGARIASLLFCLAFAGGLQAEVEFEWDGFGSIGAGLLDDNSINKTNANPHNLFDEDLQFDVDSRLGVQGTLFANDAFSATVQIVAHSAEEEDAELEWAYLSYDPNKNLKIRAGRQRRPFFALTDVLPVGYVYPWIRPPLEVYRRDTQLFDELDAIDLLYTTRLGSWDITTEIYVGQSSGEVEINSGEDSDFKTRDDVGIILDFQMDWLSLQFGYHDSPDIDVESSKDLETLFDNLRLAGFSSVADAMENKGFEGELFSFAAGIDYQNWLFNTEVIHLPLDGGLVPEASAWYIMGGRRFGPWTAHLTYGELERKADHDFSQPIAELAAIVGSPGNAGLLALAGGVDQAIAALEAEQSSYTLGLRYDFAQPVSIKAEYQYIRDEKFDLTNNLFSFVVDFLF